MILLISWFLAGFLGAVICRDRWFRVFGDYEGAEWDSSLAIMTVLSGFGGFLASIIYWLQRRK